MKIKRVLIIALMVMFSNFVLLSIYADSNEGTELSNKKKSTSNDKNSNENEKLYNSPYEKSIPEISIAIKPDISRWVNDIYPSIFINKKNANISFAGIFTDTSEKTDYDIKDGYKKALINVYKEYSFYYSKMIEKYVKQIDLKIEHKALIDDIISESADYLIKIASTKHYYKSKYIEDAKITEYKFLCIIEICDCQLDDLTKKVIEKLENKYKSREINDLLEGLYKFKELKIEWKKFNFSKKPILKK